MDSSFYEILTQQLCKIFISCKRYDKHTKYKLNKNECDFRCNFRCNFFYENFSKWNKNLRKIQESVVIFRFFALASILSQNVQLFSEVFSTPSMISSNNVVKVVVNILFIFIFLNYTELSNTNWIWGFVIIQTTW